jgi:hypothetical protein
VRTAVAGILLYAALAGCNKQSEPDASGEPASRASATPPAKPPASRPEGPSDVTFDAPAGWTKAEKAGPMRKATYHVPPAPDDADDVELSVSQAGGTVDQNIARWALQLERKLPDVKRDERTVNGLKVTVVEIHGDYTPMAMPGSPSAGKKPRYALLGAIVQTSPPTFLKLVGPEKSVGVAHRDFDKLVDSLRAK